MTILTFEFEDEVRGWTLERTHLAPFNLLVGVSGVGKTNILNSLDRVRRAATSSAQRVPGCSWSVRLEVGGVQYEWSAATTTTATSAATFDLIEDSDEDLHALGDGPLFLRESIQTGDGEKLVERDGEVFRLMGKDLPKLKATESTINLLRDEERIRPIHQAMKRFLYSQAHMPARSFLALEKRQIEKIKHKASTFAELREASGIPFLVKAYVMQDLFPTEFQAVKEQYTAIFGGVKDVRIGALSDFENQDEDAPYFPSELMTIAIQEQGVSGWLAQHRVSSGMLRTLYHLLELSLAPAGTVVMIDEFENSLGPNCLPELAERILERANELQFIITSHHPYVINNIPTDRWRVVTRRGNRVRVLDADDIPALRSKTAHDRFTILNNLPQFEQGIQ